MPQKVSKHVRKPSKTRLVPISQMRVPPVGQRSFKQAWGDNLATNLDLNQLGFPVINHRDGVYWIIDGQHRVYALKQNDFANDSLECVVYEDLTDAEAAHIFLGLDDRRAISPFDKFGIACVAGAPRECEIRRIVEINNLKISKRSEEGCIGAVGSLTKAFDRFGGVVLGKTLRTIKNAYAGDSSSFDASAIEGLALVFNRYDEINEKELAARLNDAPHGMRGLLRRAESQRERTGNQKAQCVAAVVVEIYNKGTGPRSAKRLPSWWKNDDSEIPSLERHPRAQGASLSHGRLRAGAIQ